jgi:nitrogen PTS system EIIA component
MELAVNDIVALFNVSEQIVNQWITKKEMPCIKVDQQYRFNYIELLEWVLKYQIELTPELIAVGEHVQENPDTVYGALKTGNIYYNVEGDTRDEVLRSVVNLLPLSLNTKRDSLVRILLARKEIVSTSIGSGIAIPNVCTPLIFNIDKPAITLCFLKNPIRFDKHKIPISIVFSIVSPSVKKHLTMLSRLAFCLQRKQLRDLLANKASPEDILAEVRTC